MSDPNGTKGETGREEALFEAAAALSGSEREGFLKGACHGDPTLRRRLERRLTAEEQPPGRSAPEDQAEVIATVIGETTRAEEAGLWIGRYRLLEKLGEGGFGTVWAAEQKEPVKRRIALKIIKLGMDTKQVVARFEAERQALAMMDHPNIAKVLDAGATELGRPYFVMELVRGVKITEYCDQASLSTNDRLALFIKVCQAIQHAHQKGIIHRDIKPSNILVTLHDGVPVPKVIDFGIAKATQQELTELTIYTQHQQFIGTPAYMSPEQAEMSGLDIDTRSDIYSLGVLLYELLAGSTPFDAKELVSQGIDAMRKIIRENEPVRPSTRLATLPKEQLTSTAMRRSADSSKLLHQLKGDLDWIVMKCLEKDRTRRYDTANGITMDIQRHLLNEPVLARPPTQLYRFQKMVRRNKPVAIAATGILAALAIGLGLSTRLFVLQRVAYRTAEKLRKSESDNRQRAEAALQESQRAATALKRTTYVAEMALVHQATAEGNLARARSLLDHYRLPGEEDMRGFEWHYLSGQARSDEAETLGPYRGGFGALAVSPDGSYLASAAAKGVEIRSLQNNAVIITLPIHGEGPFKFSPDGQLLLLARDEGLSLWNTRTWKEQPELTQARAPFAFRQDGQVIVAMREDHLSLWDAKNGSNIADLSGSVSLGRNTQQAIAVTLDGNRVFLGCIAQIRSWDLRTRQELEPMKDPLGEPLSDPLNRSAICLAISPQGLLAAGSWGGKVTLWDINTHQQLQGFPESHLGWVSSVVFSKDGALLASASADQNVFLYETATRKRLRAFRGHEGEIWALQFSPDAHWLISGSDRDQSMRLWDATDQRRRRDEIDSTIPLRFVDSNRSLICISGLSSFARVDVKTGTSQKLVGLSVLQETSAKRGGFQLAMSPDGVRAAVSAQTGTLEIWNILSGEREPGPSTFPRSIECAVYSQDGKHLAAAGEGGQAYLWNTTDWSLERLGEPSTNHIRTLAFSLDGTRLAQSGGSRGTVFDLFSKKAIFGFEQDGLMGMAISPQGRYLAAGTEYNAIRLWDLITGQKLGPLRGHVAGVRSLAFSPDGKTLASCGDTRVKLWNIQTLQEILTLAKFSSSAASVLFSSDGSCLATSTDNDQLQIWRAPAEEAKGRIR